LVWVLMKRTLWIASAPTHGHTFCQVSNADKTEGQPSLSYRIAYFFFRARTILAATGRVDRLDSLN